MRTTRTGTVLQHLRESLLPRDGGGLSDGQLLGQFIAHRDGAAFAALVRRHGPMVLAVCRRALGNEADAEDAFQAAFLVLARKALSVRDREAVGGWLYRVAYRAALEARARKARRRAKERPLDETPHPEVRAEEPWRELLPLLDQELSRLPDKYRLPVVLCDLEGRTRREVARQLGVPEGTLSSRLATARKMLAKRLARFGPGLSAAALSAALSEGASAAVPAPLVVCTARAAGGVVPANVAAITEGVVKVMLLAKLKAAAWVVALAVMVGAGAVGLTYRSTAAQPRPDQERVRQVGGPVENELEALRLEIEALRKGLQATRERVKVLEAEVQTLRGKAAASPKAEGIDPDKPKQPQEFKNYLQGVRDQDRGVLELYWSQRSKGADVLAEAEAAMRALRKNPDDKHAAETVARALKWLQERAKSNAGAKSPPKK